MKKIKSIIAITLSLTLVLSGCAKPATSNVSEEIIETTKMPIQENNGKSEIDEDALVADPEPADSRSESKKLDFNGLNDPTLLDYIETAVYSDVSDQLGENYVVQNVSASYVSKEYLEELAYNSKMNIFFGYSLEDLDAEYEGTRYVFTLDENGETDVEPFEDYDDTYEKVIKNAAIGTGVILICVTVSAATGGAGMPAVSMIFAASAKSGAVCAASSGIISTVITGTVTGMKTGDFKEALKAGTLAGSESFKWGAISGSVLGGTSELIMLKTAAKGGLSLNEAATIIKETGLPANFVKQIHSMDEYYELLEIAELNGITIQTMSSICMSTGYPLEIVKCMRTAEESMVYFEQAGLYFETIDGQAALIRSIDLNYTSELGGRMVTNLERMQEGYAAIDPVTGKAFQLHHVGQSIDSPLAILSQYEHTGGGNYSILHDVNIEEGVHSIMSNSEWMAQKVEFWESMAEYCMEIA